MVIPTCKECDNDPSNFEQLPLSFMWERQKIDDAFLLKCKKCGQLYCLSVFQCIVFYLLLTAVITIFLIIPRVNFILTIVSIVFLLLFFPLPFYITWNELPWKKAKPELAEKKWKVRIGLNIAYIAAFSTAFVIAFWISG